MFMKERVAPEMLESLPRLLHRLPKGHAAYELAANDRYKMKAGFGGEQHVDNVIRQARWREPIHAIGDLQLADRSCQIDTVLLTPYFAVILEVKNYTGTLSFDEKSFHMKQQTRDGQFMGFNSSITQAWNAQEELKSLFEQLAVSLSVYDCVVLPYPTTLIEQTPVEVPFVYGYSLKRFISSLPRTGSPLSPEEMARVGQLLIECHRPFSKKNFQEWYRFSSPDLKRGVLCGVCGLRGVKQSQRMFFCDNCQMPVSDGYARGLADWFDFVSPQISSVQCREFLGLKDAHAVRYLMAKMQIARRGNARGIRYYRE